MKDNLELWNKVCTTELGATKGFKGKGGFKGTAIDAQTQRKKATEIFGVFGIGWKVDNEDYQLVSLHEDRHYSKIFYRGTLSFHYNGEEGSFPIASEIDVFNYNRTYDTWTMNNDLYKKVRTDAMTKGLSELGFNSDVFEGKFDDNKYIQELKEKEKPIPKKSNNMKAIIEFVTASKMTEEEKIEARRAVADCKGDEKALGIVLKNLKIAYGDEK